MLFIKPLLLLVSAVSAAAIVERAVPADLVTVNNDVVSFTNAVLAWNGQVNGLPAIYQAEQKLEKDLNATIKDVNASAKFSCTDSTDTVNYVKNTLEPNIKKLVQALIQRKPQFTSTGWYNVIKQEVVQLRKEFKQLFVALLGKMCNAATQNGIVSDANAVDSDWATAVNAFP